jgi:hypothetical protein
MHCRRQKDKKCEFQLGSMIARFSKEREQECEFARFERAAGNDDRLETYGFGQMPVERGKPDQLLESGGTAAPVQTGIVVMGKVERMLDG